MYLAAILLNATISAVPATEPPRIDGRLDDAVWQGPAAISGLTQRSPQEGKPSDGQTEVWIAFDRDALYVAFRARQTQPVRHYSLEPDFGRGDDALAILIDPWKDRRNGYLFEVNANGARKDVLITDSGRRRNKSWDGVWWAEAQITDGGWSAELRIPFSTLSFPSAEVQTWGFNVQRRIAAKPEESVWRGWQRRFSFGDPGVAGSLEGLRAIRAGQRFELRPFGMAGLVRSSDSTAPAIERLASFGADLDMLITPPIKLSLTVNPDFAQVEADQAQLNLSHHSLYLPEKRPFFLEGKDFFSFGTSDSNQPFYSRRIGLNDDGETQPILAGLRLLGRSGRTSFGVLSAQLGEQAWTPANTRNASVLRMKRDLFKRSSVGGLATVFTHGSTLRSVAGLDVLLRNTEFMKKKTIELAAAGALGWSDAEGQKGETWRLALRWPNATWSGAMSWERISADYDPPLGFIALSGVDRLGFNAHYTRHFKDPKHPLRNVQFGPFNGYLELDDQSGKWGHYRASVVPFEAVSRSGMWGKVSLFAKGYELSEPWSILEDFTAKAGPHHDRGIEAMFANGWGRRLGLFTYLEEAQYFGGRRSAGQLWTQWKASPQFRLAVTNGFYWIRHADGDALARHHTLRARASLNRAWHASLLGQWNSESEETLINLRLRYIPRPGANAYLVFNQAFDKDWKDVGMSLQAKLVWRYGI